MLKTFFINSLKLLVAAALIGWLLQSGKLDFKLLSKLAEHPFAVLSAVILSLVNFALISIRWRSILQARTQVELSLSGIYRISWIGQFFSSVLPGSVSGDLVKMLYIQKYDPNFSKRFIFASIIIDRLMGLSGLVLLVGFSSLFFSKHILENAPLMQPLLNVNYILMAIVILSLIIFTFFHKIISLILFRLRHLSKLKILDNVITLWDDLVAIKSQMLRAVIVSLGVQFIGVVIFWSLVQPFVNNMMDFVQALAFIPLGLMTLALPVAPSGLGVGHAIFQKLFEFSGIHNGASLFNLYFVVTLAVNVMGVIPYLVTKAKKEN